MVKALLILLPCVALSAVVQSNPGGGTSTEKAAVLQVVQSFFDALANNDAEALGLVFAPESQIVVAPIAARNSPLRRRTVEEETQRLKDSKAKNPGQKKLERMWNPSVLIENGIAVVVTPYDFHVDRRFSHNGTDVFTLMRLDGKWKIVNAAYTVEPGGASRHPAGSP